MVVQLYGEWPSFHDAEVLSIALDRSSSEKGFGPFLKARVHCFTLTSEITEGGVYRTISHAVLTITFCEVIELEWQYGFGSQNSLSTLIIEPVTYEKQPRARYKVRFVAHETCDLQFLCSSIEVVDVLPGIPEESVYA